MCRKPCTRAVWIEWRKDGGKEERKNGAITEVPPFLVSQPVCRNATNSANYANMGHNMPNICFACLPAYELPRVARLGTLSPASSGLIVSSHNFNSHISKMLSQVPFRVHGIHVVKRRKSSSWLRRRMHARFKAPGV